MPFDPTELPSDVFLVHQALMDNAKKYPWSESKWVGAAFSALMLWEAEDERDEQRPSKEAERAAMVNVLIECAPPGIKAIGTYAMLTMLKDNPFS